MGKQTLISKNTKRGVRRKKIINPTNNNTVFLAEECYVPSKKRKKTFPDHEVYDHNCTCKHRDINHAFHCEQFQFKPNGAFIQDHCCLPLESTPAFICDNRIQLRLAGLNGNLNFQLFRFQGCPIKVEIDCPDANRKEKVEGIICNAGTNFVDIKQNNGIVVTLLQENIRKIEWLDPDCNPCAPQHHCPICCDDKCDCDKDDFYEDFSEPEESYWDDDTEFMDDSEFR